MLSASGRDQAWSLVSSKMEAQTARSLLQRRRAESRIDGRVQGEIKKSFVEFLDRGQMHKVKHRQRGRKKMQSAADDGLGRSLHVNVDRWGRRLGFGVEQLAEEMAIVPGLA